VAIGRWLAEQPVHLLTGAGNGVMRAVSKAFAEVPDRRGQAIGIIPSLAENFSHLPKAGYPNEWVEIPIYTHLPLSGQQGGEPMSRNHLIVLSATAIVALPGGMGTASEVSLALKYKRPVIAYLKSPDEIEGLPEGVRVESDFDRVKIFIREQVAGNYAEIFSDASE
jgi:uncharacterized protein (TIGR00725 family)